MRKTTWLVVALLTGYLAGMYHLLPLMVLCVMELLIFVMMYVLSRYMARRLTVSFAESSMTMMKNAEAVIPILIRNTGIFPVHHIVVQLKIGYRQALTQELQKVEGSADVCATSTLEFLLKAPNCGQIDLCINGFCVYDYLSLFAVERTGEAEKRKALRRKKKKRQSAPEGLVPGEEKMGLAVFPTQRIYADVWEDEASGLEALEEEQFSFRGEESQEIRQMREYQPGDARRRIHWNLSAKTGKFWVREYEREANADAVMLLDTRDAFSLGAVRTGAFFELTAALTGRLLQHAVTVRVYACMGKEKVWTCFPVTDEEQCMDMLLQLYRDINMEASDWDPAVLADGETEETERMFRLDTEFAWYRDDELLQQFSWAQFQAV